MRTEPHSASVERRGDRGEGGRGGGEEEAMSSTDPDGQPNIPHGIFLFRNPILPNVIDVDWIQWNKANRFSSSDEALMALSPIFSNFSHLNCTGCPQLAPARQWAVEKIK